MWHVALCKFKVDSLLLWYIDKCNMIADMAIFIKLHNYSTILFSSLYWALDLYGLFTTPYKVNLYKYILDHVIFWVNSEVTPIEFSEINLLAVPWKDWQSITIDFTF